MTRLYLASASPRRADLLQQVGVPFQRLDYPGIDEQVRPGEPPQDYVLRMAEEKARAGWDALPAARAAALVLGADTTVVSATGAILGKPADADDASAMLRQLSGTRHRVLSAVSLCSNGAQHSCVATTWVQFRALDEALIARYVATGEPFDKAGSYGVQGFGALLVERLDGNFSTVVGLPLLETCALLEAAGVPAWQSPEAL